MLITTNSTLYSVLDYAEFNGAIFVVPLFVLVGLGLFNDEVIEY